MPVIGATALLLQADYERRTKDSDILETAEIDQGIRSQLLSLAGQGSKIHRRYQMYLEVVASGLPFLPQRPRWVPVDARADEDLQRCVRNLHQIERDFFLMDETPFDLSAIDR